MNTFDQVGEQFPFLYAGISSLSSIMVDVKTEYKRKIVYPMIYFALVGPAGTNKGVVKYASKMLRNIHLEYKKVSDEKMKQFNIEYRNWLRAVKKEETLPEPTKPPYQVVMISADITKAKLIQQLNDNIGVPTYMINDEIDTLLSSTKSQYGNGISALLRTAYHHDLISQQLKSENQHYEIEEPKIAVCLAGTPSQMLSFIENVENGLYSRFTILLTDDYSIWQSVAPCPTCPNREETFVRLASEVFDFHEYLKTAPISVSFTEWQWELINDFGKEKMNLYSTLQSEHLGAVVKRHALMAIKIAMVLTVSRAFETKNQNKELLCDKESFVAAFILVLKSFYCAVEFFESFSSGKQTTTAFQNKQLLNALPHSFTRLESIDVAKGLNISIRSLDRALSHFVAAGYFIKIGFGKYEKTELAKVANLAN
jgi:hypothetical protein